MTNQSCINNINLDPNINMNSNHNTMTSSSIIQACCNDITNNSEFQKAVIDSETSNFNYKIIKTNIDIDMLKKSFLNSVEERINNSTKTKNNVKTPISNISNEKSKLTEKLDNTEKSRQNPLDELMNSFFESVKKREEIFKNEQTTIKLKVDNHSNIKTEKQLKILNLIKMSYESHRMGGIKKPVYLEPPPIKPVIHKKEPENIIIREFNKIFDQYQSIENFMASRSRMSNRALNITDLDHLKTFEDKFEKGVKIGLKLFKTCSHCNKFDMQCVCNPDHFIKKKPLEKCRYCWKFEKENGEFIKCKKCIVDKYPDINYFCSTNCELNWWDKEHMAEHLEFDLGLSEWNKK